jgi:hypothetical protein
MYGTLLDQCIEVFDIRESSVIADSLICYGGMGLIACKCVAKNSDFLITIRAPQDYGQVQYWQDGRRRRKQTTGLLHVVRLVPALSAHFDWIDPVAIAQGFGISKAPIEIDSAAAALSGLLANDDWFSPQLRHDGAYELVSTSISDPRAIRLATLFQNRKAHVAIWEIRKITGLGLLEYQTGYPDGDINIAVSKMSDAERFEGCTYEFELAGKSSFDFSVL